MPMWDNDSSSICPQGLMKMLATMATGARIWLQASSTRRRFLEVCLSLSGSHSAMTAAMPTSLKSNQRWGPLTPRLLLSLNGLPLPSHGSRTGPRPATPTANPNVGTNPCNLAYQSVPWESLHHRSRQLNLHSCVARPCMGRGPVLPDGICSAAIFHTRFPSRQISWFPWLNHKYAKSCLLRMRV